MGMLSRHGPVNAAREYNRLVKSDRTFRLIAASVVIFLLSFFLQLSSVHTYCEDRTWAGVFGVIAAVVFVILLRNRAGSTLRKVMSGIGLTLCLLAVGIDVAFIVYFTHLCRHMFDQLH